MAKTFRILWSTGEGRVSRTRNISFLAGQHRSGGDDGQKQWNVVVCRDVGCCQKVMGGRADRQRQRRRRRRRRQWSHERTAAANCPAVSEEAVQRAVRATTSKTPPFI